MSPDHDQTLLCARVLDRLVEGDDLSGDRLLAEHLRSCVTCFRALTELRDAPRMAEALRAEAPILPPPRRSVLGRPRRTNDFGRANRAAESAGSVARRRNARADRADLRAWPGACSGAPLVGRPRANHLRRSDAGGSGGGVPAGRARAVAFPVRDTGHAGDAGERVTRPNDGAGAAIVVDRRNCRRGGRRRRAGCGRAASLARSPASRCAGGFDGGGWAQLTPRTSSATTRRRVNEELADLDGDELRRVASSLGAGTF